MLIIYCLIQPDKIKTPPWWHVFGLVLYIFVSQAPVIVPGLIILVEPINEPLIF